jgi:hypothetical protein
MAETKKPKTIKKVTEIPNASVTIEVEETADNQTTTEGVLEKTESVDSPPEMINDIEAVSSGLNWKKAMLIILIVVPIGFLIFGGLLYFSKDFNFNSLMKQEPKKTIEIPSTTPEPTKPEVDKQAYTIDVQNGSGIAGEAASVQETLDKAGFKTGEVGNADNSDYTLTIIKVNKEVPQAFIDELTQVLEERGPVGKVEKFAQGETGEVLVIIGSDLADTTPTPTP